MGLFDGILGGVASGVMGLIGGKMQNDANANQADKANNFSAAQTQQQMDFQQHMFRESTAANQSFMDQQNAFQRGTLNTAMAYDTEMANTQMQRRMADLKAAGLNPMLAYSQGGAAAPQVGGMSGGSASAGGASGGASAHASMARMENVLAPAMASAVQTAQSVQAVQNMAEQIEKTKAETGLLRSQRAQVDVNTGRQVVETMTEKERQELMRQQQRWEPGLRGAQTAQAGSSARLLSTQADLAPEVAAASVAQSRATAGNQHAQETRTRQGTDADRTYGRSTHSPAEMIGQPVQAIGEAIAREFNRFLERIR